MSIEFSFGNLMFVVPEAQCASVCATGKGIHCKLVLRLFDFYFCGKTPLLKLWRKGKLNATVIFTSLLNCSDERES